MGLEMRDADSWRLDCSKAINEHVSYSGGGREQDWPAFRYELVADNRTCRRASGNVDAGFSAVAQSGARLLYNAACYCSLSGEAEHVIDLLERACELGGGSRDRFEHDRDLDPLRGNPRFSTVGGTTRSLPGIDIDKTGLARTVELT